MVQENLWYLKTIFLVNNYLHALNYLFKKS